MNNTPNVTCIMPTRDRRPFVAQSITYFLRQDYPNRELIIVDDGDDPVVDLTARDPRIRYMRLEDRRTIGAKRNLACANAHGGIIVHWDDDDWMADWRLSYQVSLLLRRQSDICGLSSLFYYDLTSGQGWQYVYRQRDNRPWVAGNTLCYTKAFWQLNPFLNLSVGEDTHFIWSDHPKQVAVLPRSNFFVALMHASNVSLKQPGRYWHAYPASRLQRLMGDDWHIYIRLQNGMQSHSVNDPGRLAVDQARHVTSPSTHTAASAQSASAARLHMRTEVRTTDKIAVVVTCHEPHLKWLPEAVASIEQQSLKPIDLSISFDRCQAIPQLDSLWKITRGDWGHPSYGRNAGLAATTAPWLIFWDADNVMPAGYIVSVQRAIEAANSDVAVLYPDIQYCDEQLTPQRHWRMPAWNYWEACAENIIDTASAWRREALELVGGWPVVPNGTFEDYDLALRLTASGWKPENLNGPAILKRVHSESRSIQALYTGRALHSLWKSRSLAVVTLLAGRERVFERWVHFLQNAELPPKTALYVVDNSGVRHFTQMANEACLRIATSRNFAHLDYSIIGNKFTSQDSNRDPIHRHHQHVAQLYASLLPRVTEELILTLEDDVEPPLNAVRELGEEIGWTSRGKIGAVAAAYPMAEHPGLVCAGRGNERWGPAIPWSELPQEPIDIGCVGGGCTIWASWALRRRPIHFWWHAKLGWDAALCIQMRNLGYRVRLHGGVRCQHHTHGLVSST